MAAQVRVPDDGRVVLPPEIAGDIGVEPGAMVTFRTVGPHTAEITVRPGAHSVTTPDGRPSDTTARDAAVATLEGDTENAPRELQLLTLAEMLERYPIEGPIEEISDEELWDAASINGRG